MRCCLVVVKALTVNHMCADETKAYQPTNNQTLLSMANGEEIFKLGGVGHLAGLLCALKCVF